MKVETQRNILEELRVAQESQREVASAMGEKPGVCLTLLACVAGMSFGTFCSALITMLSWNWFAVPLGAPHIGLVKAYTVYFLVASIALWVQPKQPKDDRKFLEILVDEFLGCLVKVLFLIGVGFLLHLAVS